MAIQRNTLMPHDETVKRFKKLRDAYANHEKLGKVTTDRFMRLLLNMWEQGAKQ